MRARARAREKQKECSMQLLANICIVHRVSQADPFIRHLTYNLNGVIFRLL